jgi:hypothetical protein
VTHHPTHPHDPSRKNHHRGQSSYWNTVKFLSCHLSFPWSKGFKQAICRKGILFNFMILGICKCWRLHHGFISLWSFVFELPCKTTSVPIQLLAYLGWPPHAHKSTPRFFSLHLKATACMEGSFIKWRTLPLIVLKSFAIWMKNLYSGEGLLPWAFSGVYTLLGYCPQIMGPLGACISLYVKPTLAVSFLVLEERTLHPWIMPWGMVVTSWSKQPSSPPKWRFASYFMLG